MTRNKLSVYAALQQAPVYENLDLLKHGKPADILNALAAAQEAQLMRSAAELEKAALLKGALTPGLQARLP